MDYYKQFFDDLWESEPVPRYAKFDGKQARILIGRVSQDYQAIYGVTIVNGTKEITLVKGELGEWKPKPGSGLVINEKSYKIHQDIPAIDLDPEGVLLKVVIHPV